MAAKQERRDLKNRLPLIFKARRFTSDDEHNEEKSLRQKVSKLFSKVSQFFAKFPLNEPDSPSFPGKFDTNDITPMASELLSKYGDTCSPEVSELPSERKELDEEAAGRSCSDIGMLSTGIDEHSSDIAKLSPKGQELSPKTIALCYEKRRSVETENFMFPSASKEVDRKWGLWLIDLGNFRKLGQFSFLNLNLAEKPKNKRKKYKN